MKKLLSGITLGIVLCGLYASAQQPHVAQTLPSATVKLNGASGGGGSGTGFTWDAGLDAWVFTPPSDTDATDIVTDNFSVLDSAENVLLGVATKIIAHVPLQVAGDTFLQLEEQELDASGAVVGSLVTCETTAGAVVATMTAGGAGDVGRFAIIRRSGANTCTVGVGSGQTLDGVTDGTTTISNGAWKTFVQTGAAAWATESAYPVTGTLSGLTATKLPVATSATAVGDSAITHVAATGVTTFGGSGPKLVIGSQAIDETAAAAGLDLEFTSFVNFVTGGSPVAYITSSGTLSLNGTGSVNGNIHMTSAGGIIGWNGFESNLKDDGPGQVGVYGASGVPYGQLNVGTIQQSYSKALVDATATDVVQVPVASNSYEGFTLDYTIFATDATDYQVRQGSVPVAVLNVGGTETCVFGTATEAVNVSAGTLTVAFDCTAGTNTVMVRANANTSLASTTVFTIQQRVNLTSGTAVLVPQ